MGDAVAAARKLAAVRAKLAAANAAHAPVPEVIRLVAEVRKAEDDWRRAAQQR
jgi:hypothetical protein